MKLIIAGSRDFDKAELVVEHAKQFMPITEIVCGMCRGADMLGYSYAKAVLLPIKEFPANWDANGKAAGYIRNEQMARYADAALIFWDGRSKGTKHMIDLSNRYGLKTVIIKY